MSKAQGRGGSFLRIEDPAPKGDQLTAIDGFEIAGYAQAIVRISNEVQRFDITNNLIRDNTCGDDMAGAGVVLDSVRGKVQGNVFRNNACGRGGALFIQDNDKKTAAVLVANNLVDNNHGTEPGAAHGGAFYLFGRSLTVTGNLFTQATRTPSATAHATNSAPTATASKRRLFVNGSMASGSAADGAAADLAWP